MYTLTYSLQAVKFLKKLEKKDKLRIIKSLERCRVRPHSHVKKLIGTSAYSLRVGNYRLILDILNNELRIFIIDIGHRKKVYKK